MGYLNYGQERPQGGKILDGVLFPKRCTHVIMYVVAEGAQYETLGCESEETADLIMKQFEETGEINNPKRFMDIMALPTIRPYTVVKLEAKASKTWVPDKN